MGRNKLYVRGGVWCVGVCVCGGRGGVFAVDCKKKDRGRSNLSKVKKNTGGVMHENTGEGGGARPNAKLRGEFSIANI